MAMNSTQRGQLRKAMLSCRYMNTQEGRNQIRRDLQSDYEGITFPAAADPPLEVAAMIDVCLQFGGLQCLKKLLTILATYEGGEDADPVKAVWAVWDQIVTPGVPKQLRQPRPGEGESARRSSEGPTGPQADVSLVGRELHWDRKLVVDEFVNITLAKPGKEDVRVLAIPAPREADPDSLIQRLEAICNELAKSSQMGIHIVPVRLQLTQDLLSYQIVVRMLSLLASRTECSAASLRETCNQINKEWGPRETRQQLSPDSLANALSRSLQVSAPECRPVILIQGFDDRIPEETRWWLLNTWLESYHTLLQGVLVVVAGTPRLGLEALSQPPYMVCFDPLPEMTARDLWEWAHDGHHLTWLPLEFVIEYNAKRIHGSPLKFYESIEAFKELAQWVPEDQLLALLSKRLESSPSYVR